MELHFKFLLSILTLFFILGPLAGFSGNPTPNPLPVIPPIKLDYEKCSCTQQLYTENLMNQFYASYSDCMLFSERACRVPTLFDRTVELLSDAGSGLKQFLADTYSRSSSQTTQKIECINPTGSFEKDRFGIQKSDRKPDETLPTECYLGSINSRTDRSTEGTYRMCSSASLHSPKITKSKPPKKFTPVVFDDKYYPGAKQCQPKEKAIVVTAPCVNSSYVQVTKNAFEEVAQCLNIKPKDFFPIINHESHFQMNVLSQTKASCFGQLTAGTIETMNNYDEMSFNNFKKSGFHSAHTALTPSERSAMEKFELTEVAVRNQRLDPYRISKLQERCPKIGVHFKKVETQQIEDDDDKSKKVVVADTNSQCNLIENPYTCLYYAGMVYARNRDISAGISHELKLPSKSGSRFIFKNHQSVEELVATWSYNGGPLVVKHFRTYLADLRARLMNPKNTDLIKEFEKGDGLSVTFFYREFAQFLRGRYISPENRELTAAEIRRNNEVANFVSAIRNDLAITEIGIARGKDPQSSGTLGVGLCSNLDSFLNKEGTK